MTFGKDNRVQPFKVGLEASSQPSLTFYQPYVIEKKKKEKKAGLWARGGIGVFLYLLEEMKPFRKRFCPHHLDKIYTREGASELPKVTLRSLYLK